MEHVKLKSDNIYSTGYDPEKRQLEVRFAPGMRLYRYDYVPESLFRGLVNASSARRFFDEHIRGTYNYCEIREKKESG